MLAATAAALAMALTGALGGCASSYGEKDPDTPGWFKSKVKETQKEPFPDLAAIPDPTPPSKSQNEWDAIEKDAKGVGAEIAANPRSGPTVMTPAEIEAFEAAARQAAEGKK
jgi:hypothetical protein